MASDTEMQGSLGQLTEIKTTDVYAHPMYHNDNAYQAFREFLRGFWDDFIVGPGKTRRFGEWALWSYWYEIIEKCI